MENMKKTHTNMNMKKSSNNFIVKLNYQYLSDMLKLDKFDFGNNLNEQSIMESFRYHKGTKTALNLLGCILKNIQNSLELVIFIEKDNYPIKAEIIYEANDCIPQYDGCDEEATDIITDNIRPLYMKEAKDTIKYYKEYFMRLYDRSRTV